MKITSALVATCLICLTDSASAQINRFSELVGKWDEVGKGVEIIERDGSVFSQSGGFLLSGSAGRCINAGANFCFEGRNDAGSWGCAYHVAFLDGNRSIDLRITEDSYQRCPNGVFSRSN